MFTPPIIAYYEQMVEVSITDEFKLKLVEEGLKKPYLLNIGNRSPAHWVRHTELSFLKWV